MILKPKGIPRHELEMAFDEYSEKTATVGVLAKRLDVSPNKFLQMYDFHLEAKEKEAATSKPVVGTFPVMAEKLKKLQINGKKARVVLNKEQRQLVYEAIAAGGTNSQLAKRFDVSEATITNIRNEYRQIKKMAQAQIPTQVVLPPMNADIVEKREEPKINLNTLGKIAIDSNVDLSFDGDFFIMKIPKKQITRTLLREIYE